MFALLRGGAVLKGGSTLGKGEKLGIGTKAFQFGGMALDATTKTMSLVITAVGGLIIGIGYFLQ